MRLALIATGLFAALVVLGSAFAVDEGEVVTVLTSNPRGAEYETTLWVVEQGGALWLRSARPDSQWLARLRAKPDIVVLRGEERRAYHAVALDDADARARVNAAMTAKYGAAARVLARFVDLDRSIPIRLDPSAQAPAPATPAFP
jgi:hypothetical protein